MKETKAKKSTYLRNFIIAVTLSAAILAAGALWVLLSWRSALDVTLTDLAGDPAALRGFTMRGQSYFDTAHTYWDLHDGYLDTGFALDPDSIDDQGRRVHPGRDFGPAGRLHCGFRGLHAGHSLLDELREEAYLYRLRLVPHRPRHRCPGNLGTADFCAGVI